MGSPPPPTAAPASNHGRHAWIVRAQFFVLGVLMGSWGVHVPSAKRHYGLDDASLSWALLAGAGGSVLCLLSIGPVIERFGLKRCMAVGGVLMCASMAGVLLASHYAALLVLLAIFGATSAVFDVTMNTQGSAVESRAERKMMSGFHGMFSAGGMAGAAASSAMYGLGVPPREQLFVMCVALGVCALVSSMATRPLGIAGSAPESGGGFAWPRGTLLAMGVLTCIAMVAEGAMVDWSTLYFQQELRSPPATAALGFAIFSASMALGRFGGDWVRSRLAPVQVMRYSGAMAAIGMSLALLSGQPWAAMLGFALVGLGLSNVVPVVFSAAATVDPARPARGIAAVSAVGYSGFVGGPVVIGFIAQRSSLTLALATVVVFSLGLALGAGRALRR